MRVLAVDPGYERLGIAVVESVKKQGEKLLYSDCYTTPKTLPFSGRLVLLGDEIDRVCKKFSPDVFAIETLYFAKNQKTAMEVSGAKGVVLYKVSKHKIPIFEYTPLQVKIAVTGYGRSDKNQVMCMVKRLIEVKKGGVYDDEYDAIAIALTCIATEKNL